MDGASNRDRRSAHPPRAARSRRRTPRRNLVLTGRRYILEMAAGGDTWEHDDWEAPNEEVDRAEVLRLARHLAEQRERLRAEELAELEELKRTLRERAAQVAARELEVERREAELEHEAAQEHFARRGLRFRRDRQPVDDDDRAYAEELLARREADVERRTAELVPR